MWRRRGNRTPFHVTDVENFYASLRDGNTASALRYGVRVLDRGLNGPPAGLRTGVTAEYDYSEGDHKKLTELAEKIKEQIDVKELELSRQQLRTTAAEQRTKAPASTESTETGDKGKAGVKTPPASPLTRRDAAKTVKPDASGKSGVVDAKNPMKEDEDEVDSQAPREAEGLGVGADDKFVGAVPWMLIAELAMMIITMIQKWRESQT